MHDDDDLPPVRDRFALITGLGVLAIAALFALLPMDSVEIQGRVVWPLLVLSIGLGIVAEASRRRP